MFSRIEAIWVTWEKQVRNRSMSSALGVPIFEIDLPRDRLRRYVSGLWRTLSVLKNCRARIVIVQNPSVVLTCLALLLSRVFDYKVVVDAHFGGVEAFNKNRIFQLVLDQCNRRADLVIVTNPFQAEYVRRIGGVAVVCEDPLPNISKYKSESGERTNVLFICSFDIDEPYLEVFAAAAILEKEGVTVSVSGNYAKVNINPADFPSVRFLGYMSAADYYRTLHAATVILDLTNHDNCLVCGAYEALAAEKPLVTSDKQALRSYFCQGVLFTSHEPAEIVRAVRRAFEQNADLTRDIKAWKVGAVRDNAEKVTAIRDIFRNWTEEGSTVKS